MTNASEKTVEGLVESIRTWALGPDWKYSIVSSYPLRARAGLASTSDWWLFKGGKGKEKLSRREGYNQILVEVEAQGKGYRKSLICAAVTSKTGKVTLFVPDYVDVVKMEYNQ